MPNTPKEEFDKINSKGRLGAYLNTVIADLEIDQKGQYFRDLFSKYDDELWLWIESKLKQAEENGRIKEWSKHIKP